MNDIEAIQLLIKMRELGITDDQVLSFKEKFKKQDVVEDGDAVYRKIFADDYSDEEILYYATPYFDELQERKKIREQQAKDKL